MSYCYLFLEYNYIQNLKYVVILISHKINSKSVTKLKIKKKIFFFTQTKLYLDTIFNNVLLNFISKACTSQKIAIIIGTI
jgi:hypothetical protein